MRVSGADLGPFEEAFAASRLRGPHNRANAACAVAVARALGADEAGVADGAARRSPRPRTGSRTCASCAACATSTIPRRRTSRRRCRRSASFDAPLHVILGGSLKGADFAPLARPLARGASAVYLIGEAAPELRRALTGWGIELVDCGTLERAVKLAASRRRSTATSCCSRRPAPPTTSSATTRSAATRFRALVEALA